jgi:hypothetical protein
MRLKSSRRMHSSAKVGHSLLTAMTTPFGLAVSFATLATMTSVVAAYLEGRLTTPEQVTFPGGTSISIIPFSGNVSTLVDFVLLDPLVIYFLQRSRIQRRVVDALLKVKQGLSPYHRVGLMIICAMLGIYAMKFYVEGSRFYDATLIPGANGQATVTVTGWIVYSWTALYIAWLSFSAMEHGVHVARLLSLSDSDIPYSPFHPDGAGGVRFLMESSLSVGYAMIGLLATFVVFVIHDKILYHIDSNRLLGFGLYIAVAAPLFALPFCKLHQLMKIRRDKYLFDSLDQTLADARIAGDRKDWTALAGCVAAVESADKYRQLVNAFPAWPVPLALALPSLSSVAAAMIPFVQKFISSSAPSVLLPG